MDKKIQEGYLGPCCRPVPHPLPLAESWQGAWSRTNFLPFWQRRGSKSPTLTPWVLKGGGECGGWVYKVKGLGVRRNTTKPTTI
jgi:hypothetical protein